MLSEWRQAQLLHLHGAVWDDDVDDLSDFDFSSF